MTAPVPPEQPLRKRLAQLAERINAVTTMGGLFTPVNDAITSFGKELVKDVKQDIVEPFKADPMKFWAENMIGPGPLVGAMGSAPMRYLYHTTHGDNLADIAAQGLKPRRPSFRGEQEAWPSAMGGTGREGRVYFGQTEEGVKPFSEPGHVTLRVPRDVVEKLGLLEEFKGSDAFTRKGVPSDLMEVLDGGTWKSLKEHVSAPLRARLQQVVDKRKEAPVKRGMVDGRYQRGEYRYYYDKPSRAWWGYKVDPEGNQLGEAFNSYSRKGVEADIDLQSGKITYDQYKARMKGD